MTSIQVVLEASVLCLEYCDSVSFFLALWVYFCFTKFVLSTTSHNAVCSNSPQQNLWFRFLHCGRGLMLATLNFIAFMTYIYCNTRFSMCYILVVNCSCFRAAITELCLISVLLERISGGCNTEIKNYSNFVPRLNCKRIFLQENVK